MESALLELGAANGIWATLFVCLFLYTLYDSRKREKEYQITMRDNQTIIGKLSDTINLDLHTVKEDIKEIKEKI